ncbi:MAG: helix-turn-helix domain-containing protein [Actinobacteria bacterium]|nr:helix-turn-helix domain-containing protein [Actinomycetota bacterium]MBU4217749.1 helix-turn-helix domain-containing protein [Actinomycetota bacterium]MBU4358938.1 helix-turn-helix domain-containing protein [Actinomycetota bacterium]MBU4391721.1 helix-turn-helix domain-containing protein [Actinomycetota bacterium]MBU4403415.1 helix-turn-helix domain-containing protein [Actinomycetota bacterium]
MNVEQLADYLSLGVRTIYNLAHDGEIPGLKVAGTWRFPKAAIDDWLKTEAGKNLGTVTGKE